MLLYCVDPSERQLHNYRHAIVSGIGTNDYLGSLGILQGLSLFRKGFLAGAKMIKPVGEAHGFYENLVREITRSP